MGPKKTAATKNDTHPDFINGLSDSSRLTMELGAEAVNDDPELFREVVGLSFTQPYPINMRAARVAEICCQYNPGLILPHLPEVIDKMAVSTTDGVKRSYLKVIDDYTGINSLSDPGRLMDLCFEWLLSPAEAVSIRFHALGILLNIRDEIPEITPEIATGLAFIVEEHELSKGMRNICLKTLKKFESLKP